MTIRLGAFHHEALNLNGDLQNLLVLSRRLNLLGVSCEVVELNGANFEFELAQGIDFALFGHGSAAAWASIDAQDPALESAVLALADARALILAVASGFERCVELGLLDLTIQRTDRISEFVKFEWQSHQLIGYQNSDSGLPIFIKHNNVYGTLLHGPLLAKNPELADLFIVEILNQRGIDIEETKRDNLLKLDDISRQARLVAEEMIAG